MIKQIKFYDKMNDDVLGGIKLDNGDVICCCCGGLIPADEFNEEYGYELIAECDVWVDISDDILGDDKEVQNAAHC